MQLLRVAAAVLNQTPLDWSGNLDRASHAVTLARQEGATILCLPELCLTGYGCEDEFHARGVEEQAWRALESLARHTHGMVVSVGLPVLHRKALYNANALLVDGRLVGVVAKRYLAGDGIHYEPRWFKPWPAGLRAVLDRAWRSHAGAGSDGNEGAGAVQTEEDVPIGDLFFDVGGVRIGFEICEDAWVAHRPGAELAARGVDVILNPSASHFAFGKRVVRERLVVEGSRAFGATYLYSNLLGNESGRIIYDGGALIASGGRLVAAGPRLSFHDVHVTSATVDIDLERMKQARTASFRPTVGEDARELRVPFSWPDLAPTAKTAPTDGEVVGATWERSPHAKEEELARALPLALFDYLRKSRSRGFVVSLSGGADSSAVSALIRLMIDLALGDLGEAGLRRKLGHVTLPDGSDPARITGALLTTVYQATENSGPVTRDAARTVAEAVGARHLELDVDAMFKGYVGLVEGAIGRRLDWKKDDLALQNIQARVRGPSVWLLANLAGALLLATSNRSEAAVGYATMDGDTCGGLSPIAGVDKAFLRRWLVWLEETGPLGLGPLPAMHAVNAQQPTAELRPQESHQTDEDDLMPYDVLDAIERLAIRDKQMPVETWRLLTATERVGARYDGQRLAVWVERFFSLWCRNQWKRERYAPSFHLDDENLDPKSWCRFPILSSGFQEELAALREAARRAKAAGATDARAVERS